MCTDVVINVTLKAQKAVDDILAKISLKKLYFNMLQTGRKAPTFKLQDQDGNFHTLKQYAGTWTVLYFYPKDNTPGCTKQACLVAESYDVFKKRKIAVIGISKDDIKSHKKFADKYSLPFTLLSDNEMKTIEKYKVLKEKKMFGKEVKGTVRATYIIDPDGKIAAGYPDVDPATHVTVILDELPKLKREYNKRAKEAAA